MRTLIDVILAAGLIALGWEQPLKDRVPWLSEKSSISANHSQPSTLNPRTSPTVAGSWMWDPNRQSILDTPRPQASPSASANASLLDPHHRTPLDPPRTPHGPP